MKPLYLPNEGAFLRYLEVPGEDPPLLWLHRWWCTSTGELLPAAVQDPLRGRRSLLVDLLGHGYSDKPAEFPYALEDHARTIITMIDTLGLKECGVVGHSMGGGIAVHVAAARADVVSLVVLAESFIDAEGDEVFDGMDEDAFVERGFGELLAGQAIDADAEPTGLKATHLGITRSADPRALYREAVSMRHGTEPPVRDLLRELPMPRWYLWGALSDPDPEYEHDLEEMGVRVIFVPDTGHPMGLQNPSGFAQAVAETFAASWSG